MNRSQYKFWGNIFGVISIIFVAVGIFIGNNILILAPIVLIFIVLLIFMIFSLSIGVVNFLAGPNDYYSFERKFVKKARNLVSEYDNKILKLFLNGLVEFYDDEKTDDKPNTSESLILGSDLDENEIALYKNFVTAFERLCNCDKKWLVISEEKSIERKSSASISVDRRPAIFKFQAFNHVYVKGFDKIPMFCDLTCCYYIYPHFLIKSINPINFVIIPLDYIDIYYNCQRFIESSNEDTWPSDGKVVDYTYQFVNKDGAPDMRYSFNKQVPIYQYGEINFHSLSLKYQISKEIAAELFVPQYHNLRNGIKPLMIDHEPLGVIGTDLSLKPINIRDVLLNPKKFKFDNLDPLFCEAARVVVKTMEGSTSLIQRNFAIGYNRAGKIMDQLEKCGVVSSPRGSAPRKVLIYDEATLENLFKRIESESKRDFNKEKENSIISEYTRPDTQIIKLHVDNNDKYDHHPQKLVEINHLSSKDKSINNENKSSLKPVIPNVDQINQKSENQDDNVKDNVITKIGPIEELNNLIGLSNVKAEISSLSNLVKIQQVRKNRGMPVSNVSYHCVFTGNPGTGKTTVARIVAKIYKDLGVLNKGHLVETDRSGLVGEYVGQTAPKTNAIIDSALDGVLFVDEAYSLVQGGQSDYGKEAISTLLKRMEDDRERLIVILAGYSKEMEEFINSNSGLQSRFNRYIDFPDYTTKELLQIFDYMSKKNDYHLSPEASSKIVSVISDAVNHKDEKFGNARFVRNLFEKIITQQANRISIESKITNKMLATIEEIDIINAVK